MRQVDAWRVHKSLHDVNVRLMKDAKRIEAIKKQRKQFREVQKKQLSRLEQKVRAKGDNKRQDKLTQRQLKRRNTQIKDNIAKQKKLKYQQQGGAIGFVVEPTKWVDNFYSSNVWKFKVKNGNLLVAFLDGSVYLYFGAGKEFLGLYNAGSKGKFIWRRLRDKYNFTKIV